MFELEKEEFEILRSQFVTSSWGGDRYLPMAFSEQGVAMLSSVLKSDKAMSVNIEIMRIFNRIRQNLLDNMELQMAVEGLRNKTENNTKNIELVFSYIDELLEKKESLEKREKIGHKITE
ncbi:hypothetical protein CNR22_12420 [Sphingobacteriaceae bacterium]|nr:hypothetical protein CNR22_12420 [Sphingobacteriaceae bacterium]